MGEMILYASPVSTASQRVHIALAIKGLEFQLQPVDINAAPDADYLAINPQGLVPTLRDGHRLYGQSLSIIEYLDDVYPEPRLLPVDDRDRARVRALAMVITSDVHPLNTLRVTDYLARHLGADDSAIEVWKQHWIGTGLTAFEAMLAGHPSTGTFCQGDSLSMADICLVPQVHLALGLGVDLSAWPEVRRVYEQCMLLGEFRQALAEP